MGRITAKHCAIVFPAALIIVFFVWALLRQVYSPTVPTPVFHDQKQLIFAHRGGRSVGPENTIHTFKKALELGANVLELDVRLTRDGHLAVIHDASVGRTTNGTGTVISQTMQNLAELDAAFDYSPDDGKTFPLRDSGISIPSLTDMFEIFPRTPMNIELKDDSNAAAEALCWAVSESGKSRDVIVASFHTDVICHFRNICPDISTAATVKEVFIFALLSRFRMEFFYRPHAAALQIPLHTNGSRLVTPQLIKAAHRLDLKVHVWTINHDVEKKTLFQMGVDGIMTDFLEHSIASQK